MFEELCIHSGKVKIRTGEYSDGKPTMTEAPCTYFVMADSYRDQNDALQVQDFFMCKGLGEHDIDATCIFVDKDGEEKEVKTAQRIDNLFEDTHEFWKLTL